MAERTSISPQVTRKKIPSSFFSTTAVQSFFNPVIQPKLTVNTPGDVYEKEADAVADRVMRMPAHSMQPVQRKCEACENEEKELQLKEDARQMIQRDEEEADTDETSMPATTPVADSFTLPMPSLLQPSGEPDFLAMRQPFFARNAFHLWDPDSALQIWQYNFDFFRRFGLPPDMSTSLSNLTAPRYIDAQLKTRHPTWWEASDQILGTTTYSMSLPMVDFMADFTPVAPSWFRAIFGGGSSPSIQRKCAACEEEESVQRKETGAAAAQVENYVSTLNGGGQPLNRQERSFFEPRFGRDFSDVRIHTDASAAASAKSLSAHAYTHGNNIVFASRQYAPDNDAGKRLMAHELTHVVQQQPQTAVSTSRPAIQRRLKAEPTYESSYLSPFLPGQDITRDPARGLTSAQRVSHVNAILDNLCPDFATAATGEVSPTDATRTAAQYSAGAKPTGCCCLHIFTRPSSTTNWRILVSDTVSPHTNESEKIIVIPGPNAPINYGHWTGGVERRVSLTNEIILGHELCGHAGLMELNAHPPHTSRLDTDTHDPTVNIQNVIGTEQGMAASDLRGLATGGTHRGESFARIEVSGFPINQTNPRAIPDATQQQKLTLAIDLIKANDFFVDLVGHTDSSGNDAINDRVSLARANGVKNAMTSAGVSLTRRLNRGDTSTPVVNRFTSRAGVRDSQPPPVALQGNPDNWRRVEIFVASFPAGTTRPPASTPTTTTPNPIPVGATALAASGDACEKRIVNGAFPGIAVPTPAPIPAPTPSPLLVAPKSEGTVQCRDLV